MLPAKLDNASVAADVCGLAVARKEDAATSMAGGPACTLPGGRGPVPTIVEDLVRNFGGFDVSGLGGGGIWMGVSKLLSDKRIGWAPRKLSRNN